MLTFEQIKNIVADCKFAGIDGNKWDIVVGLYENRPYVQIQCDGQCNITKEKLNWFSRKWFIYPDMCKNEVVRTVYKMIQNAISHEVDEKFTYKNERIYDPHVNVEQLVELSSRRNIKEQDELYINGKKMKFPGKSVSYEKLVELAGLTGTPSMTWSRKSLGAVTNGSLRKGVELGVWGKTYVDCVHTGNA